MVIIIMEIIIMTKAIETIRDDIDGDVILMLNNDEKCKCLPIWSKKPPSLMPHNLLFSMLYVIIMERM